MMCLTPILLPYTRGIFKEVIRYKEYKMSVCKRESKDAERSWNDVDMDGVGAFELRTK